MSHKILRVTAIAAAAMLFMSGCSSTVDDSESSLQRESFPGIYAQEVAWGSCGTEYSLSADFAAVLENSGVATEEFRCAMIEAPLDWNDPKNRETIELAAVHIPATGDAPLGTLFGNPGGPGGSGLELMYGLTTDDGIAEVRENYDFVGFDPRGIGRSTPVECEEWSSVREIQLTICGEEEPLVHSMGTSQVARDMDLLRTLQGDETLNYLGYSYGTILGATYSTLFPERVGQMVLDSAPDATWASPVGAFDQAIAMSAETVTLLENCPELVGEANCPVRSEADLMQMLEVRSETPLLTSDGEEVDAETLVDYLQASLYGGETSRIERLDTFGRALQGEQSQIDDLFESLRGGGASVSPGGQIVSCHSLPDDPNLRGLLERADEVDIPATMGGPELHESILGMFSDLSCAALPESGHELDRFSAPDDQTVLVIGITGDHATPFENGRELARSMGNTRFLTLEDHGHGASYAGRSACIDEATTAFLVRGELPAEGTVCAADSAR